MKDSKCTLETNSRTQIRKICELAMKTIATELSNEGRNDILAKVRPYRGGPLRLSSITIFKEIMS